MNPLFPRFFSQKNHPWAFLFFLVIALIFVSGCSDDPASNKKEEVTSSKFGYGGTNTDAAFVTEGETSTQTNTPVVTLDTNTTSTNAVTTNAPANPFLVAPPAAPAVSHDIPYGTPVPGKPGFVTSPFAPKDRYVDVRGFPPGTEVKDPYSGKIFLVP